MPLDRERRLQRFQDLLRRPADVLGSARRRQQDDEFVAAHAPNRVDRAEYAPQARTDLGEQRVAGRVAVGVVDVLETVEIDQ